MSKHRLLLPSLLVATLAAALSTSLPTRAAEVALLAGYQANAGFEISAPSQWPADSLPTGVAGDTIDLEEGASWAITVDTVYRNNRNQRVGLYYSRHDTRFDAAAGLAAPSLQVSFLQFTGTNIYPRGDRLAFFVTGGLGAVMYRPEDATLRDVTRFAFQLGGGAMVRLAPRLSLQFDVRWLPTFFNSDTAIFCSGGCAISVSADMFNQVQANAGLQLRF